MNLKQFLQSKEWAWRQMCKTDDGYSIPGEIALSDLRTFCNGTKTTFSNDPLEMARMVGRQEVFQRIMNFLNVDYSKIYDLNEEQVDDD